jgi:hypothetical protein
MALRSMTVIYNDADDNFEFFRSSSLVVSSGSGSSGLLKNINSLTKERMERISQLLGVKVSKEKIEQCLKEYNESVVFEPSEPTLHYIHRDLIDEGTQKKHGSTKGVTIKNHTYKAVLCCDTTETDIAFEDTLKIQLSATTEYLTSIHVLN